MKILVFEYSTCVGIDNLISEGYEILKSILNDLEDICEYDVDYLLMENFSLPHVHNHEIILKEDLLTWLAGNSSGYDYCLFVAPEDDLIQYRIAKILEDEGVMLLTSKSIASYTCCSKYLTYQNTPPDILKIPSIIIDTGNYNIELINRKLKYNDIVCKPDNYTSSNYIYHTTKDNLEKVISTYNKNNIRKMTIQKYIKGTPISISAIVNKEDINILSINSQLISEDDEKISYKGCVSPIQHPLEKKIREDSVKIIRSIAGLNGFVGIDYIIDQHDNIYFVELNSRITTPYIVLSRISEDNLTKYLIDSLIKNRKMKKIRFNDKGDYYNEI
ncbi:MAG: ATP-grasp domain-containing protein [Methanosphaera sp.]|nr:ATP-grasp domain-containing protein [Methanosphaera sp.]